MAKYETRNMVVINTKKPWVRPHAALVEIHIGPKQIYGEWRDRRFVYGVSMFGTLEAAERERFARMRDYVASFWNQRFAWNGVYACQLALKAGRSA